MAKKPITPVTPSADNQFVDCTQSFSMDDLLGAATQTKFVPGTVIKGKVVGKRNDGALFDIGYKAESFVPASEFADFAAVEVGQEYDVFLEEIENHDHMPSVSLEKAARISAWQSLTANHNEGSVVKGLMKTRVKGGIIVDIGGLEAFLPGSQIDIGPARNLDEYIGKEYDVKIIKINTERHNIVISRRELLEEDREDKRNALLLEMKAGDIRKGIVKNITDFGAFIDLGGVDGLLHITDMSWGRIQHPSEILSQGQEIEVMILDIDNEKKRVSLGIKQKTANPWDAVVEKFPVGTIITGKVVNVMPYGAFVELEPGIEGLIHVSETSWTKRITRASDVLTVGEDVKAVVLDIQKDTKRISLGIRQLERNPWEVLAEKYPAGTIITGKVRNMTSYGAFVSIEGDIDGMIHVSDMSWTRKINTPSEMLAVDQEVKAIILDIDPSQQRISLGLKQLESDPWENIDEQFKIGDLVKGKISKITAFGAFVELSNRIDGLIHISQISKERVERIKDAINVGDEIEARVIKINKTERRIGLSVKAAGPDFNEETLRAVDAELTEATASLKTGEAMVDMGEVLNDSLSVFDGINTVD